MKAVVDCHVHLYRRHDEGAVFDFALTALSKIEPDAKPAIVLAERAGTYRFSELKNGVQLPAGYTLTGTGENSLSLRNSQGKELVIVAGRQIATAERLEVLSWFVETEIPDGLSLFETIEKVLQSQGVPVLTWAPGKWSGSRGKLVTQAMGRETCRPLFLCDTTLRPIGWPEPGQFKAARRSGIKVFAGTDPLPFPGEERQAGKFAVTVELPDGESLDGAGLRAAFLTGVPRISGRRNNPVSWAVRYGRFMLEK